MATVFAASGTATATMIVGTTVMNSVVSTHKKANIQAHLIPSYKPNVCLSFQTCVNVQTRNSVAQTAAASLSTGTVTETLTVRMDQMKKIAVSGVTCFLGQIMKALVSLCSLET